MNNRHFKRIRTKILARLARAGHPQRYVSYGRGGHANVFRDPALPPLLHNGRKPR